MRRFVLFVASGTLASFGLLYVLSLRSNTLGLFLVQMSVTVIVFYCLWQAKRNESEVKRALHQLREDARRKRR